MFQPTGGALHQQHERHERDEEDAGHLKQADERHHACLRLNHPEERRVRAAGGRGGIDAGGDESRAHLHEHRPRRGGVGGDIRPSTDSPASRATAQLATRLGSGKTVTMGIISATGRYTGVGDGSYEDFLQTDAPINHGNSGGALVNTKGELVGINSQIVSIGDGNIGIGFAIPVNMARNVMDQLRKSGHVQRAQLGVTVQPVTSDMAASLDLTQAGGAIISAVAPGGAAHRAGLKQGDVIEALNGQPVHDTNSLRNRVAAAAPGSSATVSILRDGTSLDLTVKLDEASPGRSARRSAVPDGNDQAALGIAVAPLAPELAWRVGVPENAHGLLVEEVNPDSRAADAGLQRGDIIEEVNRRPVQSVDELREAVRRSSDKPLLLLVNREGQDRFVTVSGSASH